MPEFEPDEKTLICLYNTGSREGLMKELNEMLPYLEQDQDITFMSVSAATLANR